MILSHIIKKMLGTFMLAILAAGFFFVYAQTVSVCNAAEAQTTQINIQSYINTLLSALNNQPRETASVRNNGEVITTMTVSSEFQNYLNTILGIFTNNNLPTVPESASTNTSTDFEYIIKKYSTSSNQSLTSFYNTPEHKTELVIPYKLSPLSPDEPLLPMAEPYAVTICLSYNDATAPGCTNKKTTSQASELLAASILKKYLKGAEIRPFRVVMPQAVPEDLQIQFLRQIETDAISIIETVMLESLKNSKTVSPETEEGRLHQQNNITEDIKIARQEVQQGINWLHSSRDDKTVYTFREGKAFAKLNNIVLSGRLPENKQ